MPDLTLGLRSSSGRKRLTISSTASASQLKTQIAAVLDTQGQDFTLRKDQGRKDGQQLGVQLFFVACW